jgi:adenylosuccinate synthase
MSDLPQAARRYIQLMEDLLERPAALVSVGPERAETIVLHDYF